jgi:hypothetical protein
MFVSQCTPWFSYTFHDRTFHSLFFLPLLLSSVFVFLCSMSLDYYLSGSRQEKRGKIQLWYTLVLLSLFSVDGKTRTRKYDEPDSGNRLKNGIGRLSFPSSIQFSCLCHRKRGRTLTRYNYFIDTVKSLFHQKNQSSLEPSVSGTKVLAWSFIFLVFRVYTFNVFFISWCSWLTLFYTKGVYTLHFSRTLDIL